MVFPPNNDNNNAAASRRMVLFPRIIISIVVGVLLWCGWNYTKPSNFPIKRVKIVASYEHINKDFLQDLVASYTQNGFFYINVFGLKYELNQLPWVSKAWIKREWPDTIIVRVVERQAFLQWGKAALVNYQGEHFSPEAATFPAKLPVIFGPEKMAKEIFSLYQEMTKLLLPLNLIIRKLELNLEHYWEVDLANNTMIYLKEEDPLAQIKVLVDFYRKLMFGHKEHPKSIDLRYNTSGLAVKWE